MRHHLYNPNFKFVKEPVEFNKYTDRTVLQYCLGATMYMPGHKDFTEAILTHKYPGLTAMVMCFAETWNNAERLSVNSAACVGATRRPRYWAFPN